MKVIRGLFGLALISCALAIPAQIVAKDRVTILYDAFSDDKAVVRDWGFSALVEHDGKHILFDTGNDAATFEHNVKALGVDLNQVDIADRNIGVDLLNTCFELLAALVACSGSG